MKKALLQLVLAGLVGAVFMAKIIRLNGAFPTADTLVLLLILTILAAAVLLTAGVMFVAVGACAARAVGRTCDSGLTTGVILTSGMCATALLAWRYVLAAWPAPLGALLVPATLFLATAAAGYKPRTRYALASTFFASGIVALTWIEATRPPEVIALSPRVDGTAPADSAFKRVHPARVVLLGLDGLDPGVVERLVQEGELPTFARLHEQAARGRLTTMLPTLSPIIWSTIATGTEPESHGIHGFFVWQIRGVSRPIARFPLFLGLARFARWLEPWGLVERRTLQSSRLRGVPFWRAASLAGAEVFIENWWVSTPVERINGIALSNANGYGLGTDPRRGEASRADAGLYAFPPVWWGRLLDIDAEVRKTPIIDRLRESTAPPEGNIDFELSNSYYSDESYMRLAEQALTARQFDLSVLYFRGTDIVGHTTGAFSELFSPSPAPSPYRDSVRRVYKLADAQLARLLAVAGENPYLLIVSDHGFNPLRPGQRFLGHAAAPDGIFWLVGPDVVPGVLHDLHVLDVAPTVLHLMGFPIPTSMIGRVPTAAFRLGSPMRAVRRCGPFPEAWKTTRSPQNGQIPQEVEKAQLEELKALGYVQ